MRRIRKIALVAVAAALVAVPAGIAARKDVRLSLVAYSTPKEAYAKLIAAFQATPAGRGVTFDESYGSSGEQARAVVNGLPADVVALSVEPDIADLVKAKLVAPGWRNGQDGGMVADSVVVFAVRNGNPKHIETWSDLTRPGIQVITPNPFTSGGARWNVMAAYGAQLRSGKKPAEAVDYLRRLFGNVAVQDKSAREALQTFLGGKGDVLLTYENEAILAQKKGQPVYYVVPRQTILIENPAAVTTTTKHAREARAFVSFLHTKGAQRIFGENGYRPVERGVLRTFRYPARSGLFDIRFVGGWDRVEKSFFDPASGIMAKVERAVGGSTG